MHCISLFVFDNIYLVCLGIVKCTLFFMKKQEITAEESNQIQAIFIVRKNQCVKVCVSLLLKHRVISLVQVWQSILYCVSRVSLRFVSIAKHLYGESSLSYNVHSLIHTI